jgi:enterochelin esterase-like enzyme
MTGRRLSLWILAGLGVLALGALAWRAIGAWRGGAQAGPAIAIEAAIAEIEAGRRTTPLVGEPAAGGGRVVTFLARREGGQAPRIVSDVTGWGEHVDGTFDFSAGTMARVGQSDWYLLRAEAAPRARIEYLIAYGQADYRLDPHNPRRSAGPEAGGLAASEVVMPDYVPPEELYGPWAPPAGTVSEADIPGPCRVAVYRPAGAGGAGPYPLAVFLDSRSGQISRVLDWLIARRAIEPVVAAFVGPWSAGDGHCSGKAAHAFVAGPLLTWLASHAAGDSDRQRRAIVAISFGAKDALDIALEYPRAYSRLGLLVPGRRIGRADIAGIAEHRGVRLQVAILAGRYDQANLPTARAVRQALADAGHAVEYTEVPEGHSAVTWRNHLRAVLVPLFGAR